MDGRNFNTAPHRPRILVAPLDWGLGHATRCIPIIFKLLQENCEVFIAAERGGKALLQKEFPSLQFLELKGYRVGYSADPVLLPMKLLSQFPRIIANIYAEKRWLKKIVKDFRIEAVISDNRMGLHHAGIPSVYITHQLQIITGNSFTEKIAQKIHYHFINKFSACWVPDMMGQTNLAGALSHPATFPKTPVTYIGPLSRFEEKLTERKYDACIILSGPEPQRTILEKKILADLPLVHGNFLLVRGLPQGSTPITVPSYVTIKDHLPANELNQALLQSAMVICRSGYSSIMDLVKLKKKAILIPTPGQTEQEYLAKYLQNKKLFCTVTQEDFKLVQAISYFSGFQFADPLVLQEDDDFLKSLVAGLIQ